LLKALDKKCFLCDLFAGAMAEVVRLVALVAVCQIDSQRNRSIMRAAQVSFKVSLYALADDRRRVLLDGDRGFTSFGFGNRVNAFWDQATVDSIRSGVVNTLLPDEPWDDTGGGSERTRWEAAIQILSRFGIAATGSGLAQLPLIVELAAEISDRLDRKPGIR
jgi:hypothetical protein